jgi:hypothetical protein
MICDWRSIKTGSRTKQREPLSPPTIPLPASYGLCGWVVTYVRHAVILDMLRTFERNRETEDCGLVKTWRMDVLQHLHRLQGQNSLLHGRRRQWNTVKTFAGWKPMSVHDPDQDSPPRSARAGWASAEWKIFSWILFDDDDYRDGWRTGGLFTLRPPDVADRPREFYWTLIKFMNQQTRFWREDFLMGVDFVGTHTFLSN